MHLCNDVVVLAKSQRKCANLPSIKSNGQHTWWVGSWQYFKDSELRLTIEENGNVNSEGFEGATCEEVVITKNHSTTSAFVWGNMILKKPSGK